MMCSVTAGYQERLQAAGIRGLRLANTVNIHPDTRIEPPAYIGGVVNFATAVQIGAFTLINGGRIFGVSIGRYCSIAADVTFGGAEHPLDRVTSSTMTYAAGFHGWDEFYDKARAAEFRKRVVPFSQGRLTTSVGHDVWVGLGVTVKAGVSIGTGAVIGSGAVVTKDIPPYAIATGIPARVQRFRFSEEKIEKLLASQWWEYPLYDVLSEKILDIDAFCDDLQDQLAAGRIKRYEPRPLDAERLRDILEGRQPSA